jgi:hypothetical protein
MLHDPRSVNPAYQRRVKVRCLNVQLSRTLRGTLGASCRDPLESSKVSVPNKRGTTQGAGEPVLCLAKTGAVSLRPAGSELMVRTYAGDQLALIRRSR